MSCSVLAGTGGVTELQTISMAQTVVPVSYNNGTHEVISVMKQLKEMSFILSSSI